MKFSIFDIKLLKYLEKITSFPCSTRLKINYGDYLELGDIWDLVHEFSPPKTLNITISNDCSELNLSCLIQIEEETIEFGSVTLGLLEIENYFKGIISLSYRGLKSVFLQVELSPEQDSNEEPLNSSFPLIGKSKSQFFPKRDYPIDLKKYYTPNFLAQPSLSIDKTGPEILDKLKSSKIQFEELSELLSSKSSELIYYTLNHLIFFASQSSFASRLLTESKEKLIEILQTFPNDSLLIETYLEVVFDCLKSLDLNSSEVSNFLTEAYSKLLTTVKSGRKSRVFCMEVLIKYLQLAQDNPVNSKQDLETLLNFSAESYLSFPSDETASSLVHLFFQGIQSSKSKISSIFTSSLFTLFLQILNSHKYNLEVLKTCLKILKVFSGHKTFKEILSKSRTFGHLTKSLKIISDPTVQRLVLELVKEMANLSLTENVSNDIFFVLIATLSNSYNSITVALLAVQLCRAFATELGELLMKDEALECFAVLMVCMKGETELELEVAKLIKIVKDFDQAGVKKNLQVFNCLKAISEDYSIPSTGSNHSRDEIVFELKSLVDEILNE
jgi:hypothetical protein